MRGECAVKRVLRYGSDGSSNAKGVAQKLRGSGLAIVVKRSVAQ